MKSRSALPLISLILLFGAFSGADAQTQSPAAPASQPAPGSGAAAANAALANVAPQQDSREDEDIDYLYEHPTMEKLSQAYWALSKFDINNDLYIDNFLMINECEIYKDYYHNEFEWRTIRSAGRKFLTKSLHTFPLRFELIEPMKLGKYDLEKHHFEVVDEYKIDGVRRFEIMSNNAYDEICGVKGKIDGYPKALIVELSRPIVLGVIPVEPGVAEKYIDEKMKDFAGLSASKQTDDYLYEFRDAYLVMKVKFFAYKGDERNREGMDLANVMAILEGVEVYGDPLKKNLLYKEDYRRKRKEHKGFKEKLSSSTNNDLPNPNPNLSASDTPANPNGVGEAPRTDEPKTDVPPATSGKVEIPAYSPGGADAEQ